MLCIIYYAKYSLSYRLCAIRGSQYYDPDIYSSHKYIFNKFRYTSEKYNYNEYWLPVVDYYETFSQHLGNSDSLMDVYRFHDKSGRDLALRPEITPQLCTMVDEKWNYYDDKPLRWFTIADCWRYERPCSGRRRNHQQWNLDLISSQSNSMDAEPLLVLIHAFQSLGLTADDIKICINSTEFISKLLDMVKHDSSKISLSQFIRILDKFNRVPNDEFNQLLINIGFKITEYEKLMDLLSTGDNSTLLNTFNNDNVESTLRVLKSLGLDNWISLDLSIARGNGYYNGIIYEAFDKKVKRRAIAGGGHYQMKNISRNKFNIECSGFAMGNIVLLDILSDRNLLPKSVVLKVSDIGDGDDISD
ncbi:histidyl-tRNA synthetase [Babesia microti strain RI]|uniref:histidine--tRNA ligase n=1 Tax=Babesia microti (strain RI) TaxID=1133968 RepID=I7IQI9_BABMR|nr:histidyl-tRNA synthetase [Babesia microti strain RI]CCF73820.1 histidyl-tRNA synthetase [Babesia microti strain RI]|eukprot:XP_012648429.1 histidyl-tRNA synthetase [Babesia microti strain RI]